MRGNDDRQESQRGHGAPAWARERDFSTLAMKASVSRRIGTSDRMMGAALEERKLHDANLFLRQLLEGCAYAGVALRGAERAVGIVRPLWLDHLVARVRIALDRAVPLSARELAA